MDYELCKKLKDRGFPQGKGWKAYRRNRNSEGRFLSSS